MKALIFLLCLSSAIFVKGFTRVLFFDFTESYEQLFYFKILTALSLCTVFFLLLLLQRLPFKKNPPKKKCWKEKYK